MGSATATITNALGWIMKPISGSFSMRNEGSQKGTATAVIYFPEKNLGIAAASNLEFTDTYKYIRRLYELVTSDEWEVRAFTRDKADGPLARALDSAFNYGSLHFEQPQAPDRRRERACRRLRLLQR